MRRHRRRRPAPTFRWPLSNGNGGPAVPCVDDAPPGTTALQLARGYAAHDIQIFVEYCLEDEKSFEPIILSNFHRAILDSIRYAWEHNLRSVNLAPPGSGKTSLLLGCLAFMLG